MTLNNRSYLRGAKLILALQMTFTLLLVLCPSVVRAQSAGKPTSPDAPADRERSRKDAEISPTQAQPELGVLTITAPVINTTPGANFSVPITSGDTTGLGVASWQFDMIFDPAVIVPQANPILTTGTISDGMAFFTNVVGGNTLKVVFFTAGARVGGGVIFYVRFTAVGMVGNNSPLTWVNFMWNEGNPGQMSVPGQVNLVGPTAANASVRGRLLSTLGLPVPYVRVTLTDSHGVPRSAISSPFGYFEFTEVESGQTYVLSAEARQSVFSPRVIEVGSDIVDLEITADP